MNTQNKNLRAAIYLRVSTDEQARGGYGLDVQDEKLKTYVKLNDYTLDEQHIYRDEGYSGTLPVEERPELRRLMENAKKHEFDVLITYRLDRVFRKTRLLLEVLDDLEKLKIGFKSVTESIDTTTHTGKFVITLLGGVAEMEREVIRERTTNGRIKAAKSGKWVTGIPPYGYNIIEKPDENGKMKRTGLLKVNTEEAKWVKQFFKWVVVDRLSLREVQKKANDLKIPLPRRKVSNKKTLSYWHKRTIGRILTNENYTGIANFRKYKRPFNNLTSITDESLLRAKEDWISINIPSIVSSEMFEQCKQQLLKNRDFSKRNQKRTYLFSKIIYCGNCGFKLFGGYQPPKKEGNAGSKYYHGLCSKQEVGTSRRCPVCDQVGEVRLLPIWERIKEILKRPQLTLEKLAKYNNENNDREEIKEQLEQVKKARAEITQKRQRLALLFAEGEMDRVSYKETLLKCQSDDDQLHKDQLRLERQLLTKNEIKNVAQLIEEQHKKLTERIDSLTYEEQQEVLRLLVKRVIVYPKQAEAEVELNFNAETNNSIVIPREMASVPSSLWDNNAKTRPTICNGREVISTLRDDTVG